MCTISFLVMKSKEPPYKILYTYKTQVFDDFYLRFLVYCVIWCPGAIGCVHAVSDVRIFQSHGNYAIISYVKVCNSFDFIVVLSTKFYEHHVLSLVFCNFVYYVFLRFLYLLFLLFSDFIISNSVLVFILYENVRSHLLCEYNNKERRVT